MVVNRNESRTSAESQAATLFRLRPRATMTPPARSGKKCPNWTLSAFNGIDPCDPAEGVGACHNGVTTSIGLRPFDYPHCRVTARDTACVKPSAEPG